jgi:hypothetical protein
MLTCIQGAMTREAFEGMMAPMLDRFRGVLEQVGSGSHGQGGLCKESAASR